MKTLGGRPSNDKKIRVLVKAVELALKEFSRISYQKKADSGVIECLEKALLYTGSEPETK